MGIQVGHLYGSIEEEHYLDGLHGQGRVGEEPSRLQFAILVYANPEYGSVGPGSRGSVVVSVNGRAIESPTDLSQAIAALPAGSRADLTYYRGKQLVRKSVDLTSAPARQTPALPRLDGTVSQEPRLRLGGRGDRPLIGRIGKAIEIDGAGGHIDRVTLGGLSFCSGGRGRVRRCCARLVTTAS